MICSHTLAVVLVSAWMLIFTCSAEDIPLCGAHFYEIVDEKDPRPDIRPFQYDMAYTDKQHSGHFVPVCLMDSGAVTEIAGSVTEMGGAPVDVILLRFATSLQFYERLLSVPESSRILFILGGKPCASMDVTKLLELILAGVPIHIFLPHSILPAGESPGFESFQKFAQENWDCMEDKAMLERDLAIERAAKR